MTFRLNTETSKTTSSSSSQPVVTPSSHHMCCLSLAHAGSLSRYFEKEKPQQSEAAARSKSAVVRQQPQQHYPVHEDKQHGDGSGGNQSDHDDKVDLNHLLEIILDLEEKGVNVKVRGFFPGHPSGVFKSFSHEC